MGWWSFFFFTLEERQTDTEGRRERDVCVCDV
jgi:hypothetical protein